ncbi:MAG: POTRA domain-containing protein [Myxococcota bacterium]
MTKSGMRILTLVAFLCSGLCYASQTDVNRCKNIQIQITNPLDKDETNELREYLDIFTGEPCQQETAQNAQQQLFSLGRYRHIQCFVAQKDPTQLICDLQRFPAVRRLHFEGLPLSISARHIKRRLVSTAGQLWRNNPRVVKQLQQQVQQLLRRKGYEHAVVHISTKPLANNSMVDVVIHVQAGYYTRVRQVIVQGETPIETKRVQYMFRNMCRSLSGLWDAFSGATFACYSKEKERYTLEKLRKKLDQLGYIQAVVHTEIIKPSMQQQAQSIGCLIREKQNQKPFGRCVDLRVSIHQGPRLVSKIVLSQGQSLQLNKAGRFFRSLFAVEFFSRGLGRSPAGGKWPSDQTILMHQLHQSMTFKQNRVVNEQEAQRSAVAMKEVLSKRGYLNADVRPLPIVRTPEEIHVGFIVDPRIPTPVTQIRIVGSPHPISPNTLARRAKLDIRTRGGLRNGHLTESMLQQDTQRVQTYYRDRGYPSAHVHSSVQMNNTGQATVVYKVHPGQMHRIKHVRIIGSTDYLVKEALKHLANCKHPRSKSSKQIKKAKTAVQAGQLCRGSFYLPHKLKEDTDHIIQVHKENGYENVLVKTEVDDSNPNAITLSFFVNTPSGNRIQRTYLKNIFVEGNQKTNKSIL